MNKLRHLTYEHVQARLSLHEGDAHVMLTVTDPMLEYTEQLTAIGDAILKVSILELPSLKPVFVRLFLSDAANQGDEAKQLIGMLPCALSVVEQPPLDGTKVAAWVWLMDGIEHYEQADNQCVFTRRGQRHLFATSCTSLQGDSHAQAARLLTDYAASLEQRGLTLADNCVRTWFFVQNIDVNYAGVVSARNEVFEGHRLTRDTHYIASTGIGGQTAAPQASVMMDAYAVEQPTQHYLYAPTHLNRTSDYGVAFERGVYVDYDTHRHIMISGTASISNRGEIMHRGDIRRQMARMCDNVEALLSEAGATWADVQHIILYLRDTADYAVANEYLNTRFADTPRVIVNARVCRPGWLVEMECMAVCSKQ